MASTGILIDGNLEELKRIVEQIESGELRIEYMDIRQGINEIEPENGCRKFETTGEETVIFTTRKLKNWNESD